jgi:hypothetical protein
MFTTYNLTKKYNNLLSTLARAQYIVEKKKL